MSRYALADGVEGWARFSRCGDYRYVLGRRFPRGRGRCVFVMLNPSRADARADDPTIRRCSGFAQGWGYAELCILNLFAWRTPYPEELRRAADPVGPGWARHAREACEGADLLVAAWGVHGALHGRDRRVLTWARRRGLVLHQLGLTRDGHPRHPLYLRADARPRRWRPD